MVKKESSHLMLLNRASNIMSPFFFVLFVSHCPSAQPAHQSLTFIVLPSWAFSPTQGGMSRLGLASSEEKNAKMLKIGDIQGKQITSTG